MDENFRRIGQAIGFDEKKLVFSNQIHDTMIRRVGKEDCGKVMTGMDGLVTDVPGVPLYTGYADCVPLFFFDPVKKVAALAHSGWKGTVGRIGEKMVKQMKDEMCIRDRSKAGLYVTDGAADTAAKQIDDFLKESGEKNILSATFKERVNDFSGISKEQKLSLIHI